MTGSYSTVKQHVIESLKEQGFGILTEINVQTTLKNKLNVDFHKYEILGACNPKMAYQALQAEEKVGTMLPCNVIIQQKEPEGPVEVSAVDPVASMKAIENATLEKIASEVRTMLQHFIESL